MTAAASMRRTAGGYVVCVLYLAAIAAVEGLLLAADHGILGSTFWRSRAYQDGAFWAGLLRGWTPNFAVQPGTMFVSYAFLHAGPGHLLGNMVVIGWLAPMIGRRGGARRMSLLLLTVILGGGAGFGLLADTPSPMVGASGAAMGLIAVWIVWDAMDMRREGFGAGRVAWGTAARIALVAALNVLSFVALGGVLAWQTHLGGFVAGIGAAFVLRPDDP